MKNRLVFNLCSQVENAFKLRYAQTAVPDTITNRQVLELLYQYGFVSQIQLGDNTGPLAAENMSTNPAKRRIWIDLKYRNGVPVLSSFKAISKPSRRVFCTKEELMAVASARRLNLVKIPRLGQLTVIRSVYGIVSLEFALSKNVGGEVLCAAY